MTVCGGGIRVSPARTALQTVIVLEFRRVSLLVDDLEE
jgi:hypothetical protein